MQPQYVERMPENEPSRFTTETETDELGREHPYSEASLPVDFTHGMQEGDTGQIAINVNHPIKAIAVVAQLPLLDQPVICLAFRHRTRRPLVPVVAFDGLMPPQA